MRTTLLPGLAAMVLAAGCTAERSSGSPTTGGPEEPVRRTVEFAESALVPVDARTRPDGIATVMLVNRGSTPVEITRVEPQVEDGLTAVYLGHTRCQAGCAGEGYWNEPEDRQLAQRSVTGTVPLTIPPNAERGLSLVFRITAAPAGEAALRDGCPLRVRTVRLTSRSGETLVATGPGDRVVGLLRTDVPTPSPRCAAERA